jgi:hypothetical protein
MWTTGPGREIDLSGAWRNIRRQVAGTIVGGVIAAWERQIDKLAMTAFAGGGSLVLFDVLNRMFPRPVLVRDGYYANAVEKRPVGKKVTIRSCKMPLKQLRHLDLMIPKDHPIFQYPKGKRSQMARDWMDIGAKLSEIMQALLEIKEMLGGAR